MTPYRRSDLSLDRLEEELGSRSPTSTLHGFETEMLASEENLRWL